jgi:hypothetical protein
MSYDLELMINKAGEDKVGRIAAEKEGSSRGLFYIRQIVQCNNRWISATGKRELI